MTEDLERHYTDEEVADRLGMSISWVQKQRYAGRLGYKKIGSGVRISESQIQDFMARYVQEKDPEEIEDIPF